LTDGPGALFNGSINSVTSALIVVQQSTLSSHFDLNPFHPVPPKHPPQISDQLRIVNLAKDSRVLLQLRQRFGDLCLRSVAVPTAKVVHSDGCLNQPLVVQAERSPSRTPQVLPRLMGLKIPALVEKKYSGPEEISQRSDPSKLLKENLTEQWANRTAYLKDVLHSIVF
jgi:hypothetical protein